MLDLGLSKIAIIGTVALVVIGPERLPRVARMLGTLMGRAQRYIADVKAEVTREIQLDELRNMRDTVQSAASDVQNTIQSKFSDNQADIQRAIASMAPGQGTDSESESVQEQQKTLGQEASPAKRQKWRRNRTARQHGTPIWYRQAQRRRTRVLSGAARVARYRVNVASR